MIGEGHTGFLSRLFGGRKLMKFEVIKKNSQVTSQNTAQPQKIEAVEEKNNDVEFSEPHPKSKTSSDIALAARGVEFANEILKLMDIEAEAVERDRNLLEITGSDAQDYIVGRYGDALKSLEYLVNLTLRDPRNEPRLKIDSCGYRERRIKSLERLAEATARQVLKFGRPMRLDPMASWERWVIHTTLKDRKDVTTESIGEPPMRKVVVSPKYDANHYKNRRYRPSRRFGK